MLNTLISNAHSTPMQCYQRDLPATVQADVRKLSLDACILWNSKPIAFVLKFLTDAETLYVNTERELLAVVLQVSASISTYTPVPS